MNNSIISDFQKMIDVNTSIIYIEDYDFVRVDEIIKEVVGERSVFEWNPATGCTDFKTRLSRGMGNEQTLENFLEEKYKSDKIAEKFLVLRDVQDFMEEPKIKTLLQLMSQRRLYDLDYDLTIIIVSAIRKVPREIEKYVSYLEISFPDEEEINRLIDEHIETNQYDDNFKDEDREKLLPSLKGMTAFEIDRMLDMAMSSNGSLSAEDKGMILRQKKQMVKNSGLLELIDAPENMDSIGGMEVLKEYMQNKAKVMSKLPEAKHFGVAVPKGVFIVGMPGCGKSLCAKASAALFEAPLLKLDMGSMMGKYVGQSEANLRRAIMIAEAAAPCILWIDEIEKGFSGVGGNNDIMTRMFGYFLSWMQDKTSSVYVIATANNANNLPPELKRKGRFDEIFCVNLPNAEERKAIFNVHLKKKKDCDLTRLGNSDALIRSTEGFNGADIESVVNEAIERCFINGKRALQIADLQDVAKNTISISKSCKKQIDDMKKIFSESNFKDASKK